MQLQIVPHGLARSWTLGPSRISNQSAICRHWSVYQQRSLSRSSSIRWTSIFPGRALLLVGSWAVKLFTTAQLSLHLGWHGRCIIRYSNKMTLISQYLMALISFRWVSLIREDRCSWFLTRHLVRCYAMSLGVAPSIIAKPGCLHAETTRPKSCTGAHL